MANETIQTPVETPVVSRSQVVPLVVPSQSQTVPATLDNSVSALRERAKSLEPAAKSLWQLFSGIPARAIRNRLAKLDCEEAEDIADTLAEMVKLSPDSLKAATEASARIVARRTDNSDALDIGVLIGVCAEIGLGYRQCMVEIAKLEKKLKPLSPSAPKE